MSAAGPERRFLDVCWGAAREGQADVARMKGKDGSAYDLTREWMNEALFYPFAPKRDLIDASSRIYDVNATAPVQNEGRLAEPKSYADS